MFTETELKDALEHLAEPADALLDGAVGPRPARRTARVALPALAAAAVVGAATVAAVVTAGSSNGGGHERQSAGNHPTPSTHTRVHSVAADPHVPVRVSVNDLVKVHNKEANYDIRNTSDPAYDVEYVVEPVSNAEGPDLVVLPPSAHFDPATRFTDVQRVDVDGVSAYYGSVVLHPANGKADMDTDKHGGPQRALGIEKPGGTWLFVTSDNFAPTNLHGLITAYQKMHVVVRSGTVKMPYRTGYVPAGMSLDSLAPTGTNPVSDARLAHGRKWIDINISAGGLPKVGAHPPVAAADGVAALPGGYVAKEVDGYLVELSAEGYGHATLVRMLKTMTFGNLSDGGATWWTIDQAFG